MLLNSIIDRAILALTVFVLALFVTGGVHFNVGAAKIEISQLDPFTIPLVLLIALRLRSRVKPYPSSIESRWEAMLSYFKREPLRVVLTGIAIYVILFTLAQAVRYESFNASAFDLSYIDQGIWNTARGLGFLHSDISRGGTYLGEHFAPILGVIAPFYAVVDSIYWLFFLQALILSSGALIVYKLARLKKLSAQVATLFAVCFLLYHPLRAANGFDLREDNFYVPIFLGVLYFKEAKNWILFGLLCALSWFVKENASLFTFMLGLWMAYDALKAKNKTKPWAALVLIVASLAVFWVVNSKITPHFSGPQNRTMLVQRLSHFGSTNKEILSTLLLKPYLALWELIKIFFSKESIHYVLAVLVPFAAFARKSKPAFLIACAGVALNLLLNVGRIGNHYECIFLPFLFYVLIDGASRMKLTSSSLFLVLLSFFLFFGRSPVDSIRRLWPSERDRWVTSELSEIPHWASVATTSPLHPHLTHREQIEMIRPGMDTDYIVADIAPHRSRYANDDLEKHLKNLDRVKYENILDENGLLIWRKRRK